MVDLVKHKMEAIRALCKQHHVKALYLFGSAYDGSFTDKSDIDFLYVMDEQAYEIDAAQDYATNLFALEEGLEKLLERSVDLIRLDFNKPVPFLAAVGDKKELVYAS